MDGQTNQQRRYFYWLLVPYSLFIFRVVAQPYQKYFEVDFLPAFDDWYSGVLSYQWLLASQIIIIIVLTVVLKRFYAKQVIPHHRIGIAIIGVGMLYFSVMALRLLTGLTVAKDSPWLGATIPAFFHVVLSSFLLLVGHFHYHFGKQA